MNSINSVLDVLIELLKGSKSEQSSLQCDWNGKHYTLWACNYLLDQALRLYQIPDSHYLISEKAKTLWSQITTKSIKDFNYQKLVVYEFDKPLSVECYTGNSNNHKPQDLLDNRTFPYRAVFHDDHVVPLKSIIQELQALDDPSYEKVSSVLDKIYICRMLKEEDRAPHNKTARADNYLDVIHQLYQKNGMIIYNLETGVKID
jgi:hypothetical protein